MKRRRKKIEKYKIYMLAKDSLEKKKKNRDMHNKNPVFMEPLWDQPVKPIAVLYPQQSHLDTNLGKHLTYTKQQKAFLTSFLAPEFDHVITTPLFC